MRINETPVFREMAEAVLMTGSQLSCRAGGNSMSPFIRNNETVIIEPPARKLRVGDIILFEAKSNQMLLHRIVKKTVGGYVTRGDATRYSDGTVLHSAVLGRVVHVVGGLNFHLRFPLNAIVAHALSLRNRPRLFSLLSKSGRRLLVILRPKKNLDNRPNVAVLD